MQVKRQNITDTKLTLTVSANPKDLETIKQITLERLRSSVKLPGFREGKVPINLVEKNVDQQTLQTEFMDEALNQLYPQAAKNEKIRPVDRPKISIKKFVPYTDLEFEAEVEILGPIKLANYKTIKKPLNKVSVTDKEVDDVLDNLAIRQSKKTEVKRVAKNSDEVWIDFSGVDSKNQPIPGADGKDYPLVLGSKTFIPGFEEKLVGKKAKDEVTFTLTFPKGYGAKKLAGQKVTFTVIVKKVEEVTKPKIDDDFAKNAGPFKNLAGLKSDIKAQLLAEKQKQALQQQESDIIREVTEKSNVSIPDSLVTDQVERLLQDFKQDLTYRGLTYPEFLKKEGFTEESYKQKILLPEAKNRVKAGLVLAEIAEKESISVSSDEVDARIQTLKAQYTDPKMHDELDKEDSKRDISSRLMTEKTINQLVSYSK